MATRPAFTRKKPGLTPIVLPDVKAPYALSNSGTYTEGDFQISSEGLRIGLETLDLGAPARSPAAQGPDRRAAGGARDEAPSTPVFDQDGGFDVSLSDLTVTDTIGSGSSGVVQKAYHAPTGSCFALKVIQMDVQEQIRKNIIQELRTLHKSYCKQVVPLHGAFFREGSISIVLEYMDGGSLADMLRSCGVLHERQIRYIFQQVLLGLRYLHKELHVIHRDVKPSNLLLNRKGEVKISDFGVAGQLAHSVAKCQSWVGTVTYMSPERISGKPYSFDSDFWSLGLALVECATGRFPYPPQGASSPEPLGFWDLLDYIVERPPPVLAGSFSRECVQFVDVCLQKDPKNRATAQELLQHPWLAPLSEAGSEEEQAALLADDIKGASRLLEQQKQQNQQEREWSREECFEKIAGLG